MQFEYSLTKNNQVFVKCDPDLMLARRIQRDVAQRGRTVEGVLDQSVSHYCWHLLSSSLVRYLRFVKPSYDNFVCPTSSHADIVRKTWHH
jgi:uridine kinase